MIFFNDRSLEIEMDETFQKLWRSITVESVDEDKIAEYLAGQGITFADDPGIRKVYFLTSFLTCRWLKVPFNLKQVKLYMENQDFVACLNFTKNEAKHI